MYKNYNIIVVTPAGRLRYLKLLIPQILKLREVVDEYHLWMNTTNIEDIEYMKMISEKYPDFIKLIYSSTPYSPNFAISIARFFKNCISENTIYIRFDDDIIWIDILEAFKGFLDFRINNPDYFLVYGNILNNTILTHIHQRFGNFQIQAGIARYNVFDKTGLENPKFAEQLHNQILKKGEIISYRFKTPWILYEKERVSINCISWFGSEFAKFNGIIYGDEEQCLSVELPKKIYENKLYLW